MAPRQSTGLALWGGPECTVNRIGNDFFDQIRATGHEDRIDDLDRFAAAGFSALRYPLLWERIAPERPDQRDFAWSDARMSRLRDLGMPVIAGLVHHGSGPRYTDLLDPGFASGLADHARAVAARYPWIEDWTPVNEPLTTARFAALYGLWYPHQRDERLFWLALINQIDAVRLSMRAIRRINPAARLIQTDDLGRTWATAELKDQAGFDNVRRWMGWDLLTGRVRPGHDLWRRLRDFGLEERLRVIADDPCPPDIIGINHYLTSDRFLDHRVRRYPDRAQGGNGRQRFADTEAVRVLQPPPPGLGGVLREAWQRYGLPLAVTEVHNGCTRDEQMRWIVHAWRTAQSLRDDGVDVRAVTSWALLGSQGWDRLLTGGGRYEPGAWDVSGALPRETAMLKLLQGLQGGEAGHPAVAGEGWWRRSIRLHHPVSPRPAPMREHLPARDPARARAAPPILIAGEASAGQGIAAACRHRDLAHVLVERIDVASLDRLRPWAVIMADVAEDTVSAACAERDIKFGRLADANLPERCDALLDALIDDV
ncbi:hypothetical protein [Sphingomonas quercus]|uniref:dTDP-4-dehydrorhamnose reductase n=1 Tax=Sphingomonas quercus TaxID=2842451 RepID=A0ABS6BIT5_9SPHN|nr:hypothetical protein [Sphingomonas quercus]MBU3077527.1 hypothetical protein [Sphingomonas quercus]